MTRSNAIRKIAENKFVAWGTSTSALIFAAVLIVCSVTVGCSSDKPKPVSASNQMPAAQLPTPAPAPVMQAESKPTPKKVVHKKPATVNYTDKTYGLTFEYPRRYAIETGNAAADLVLGNPIPMNFVQPGGVALAAVELPETIYANTDFSSAFFNVSVNKSLTADQCGQFAVPAPKMMEAKNDAKSGDVKMTPETKSDTGTQNASTMGADAKPASDSAATQAPQPQAEPQGGKLLVGDLELRATEAVSGEGTRQSDSKYFHVYQNGACYEFALNVTTVASEDGITKHVDRDRVFSRLEQILNTVKIAPAAPEVTAEAPAPAPVSPASVTPTPAPETPAQ